MRLFIIFFPWDNRQFSWNVKAYILEKKLKKIFKNVTCWIFYFLLSVRNSSDTAQAKVYFCAKKYCIFLHLHDNICCGYSFKGPPLHSGQDFCCPPTQYCNIHVHTYMVNGDSQSQICSFTYIWITPVQILSSFLYMYSSILLTCLLLLQSDWIYYVTTQKCNNIQP